jgi:hypothetical protein
MIGWETCSAEAYVYITWREVRAHVALRQPCLDAVPCMLNTNFHFAVGGGIAVLKITLQWTLFEPSHS